MMQSMRPVARICDSAFKAACAIVTARAQCAECGGEILGAEAAKQARVCAVPLPRRPGLLTVSMAMPFAGWRRNGHADVGLFVKA